MNAITAVSNNISMEQLPKTPPNNKKCIVFIKAYKLNITICKPGHSKYAGHELHIKWQTDNGLLILSGWILSWQYYSDCTLTWMFSVVLDQTTTNIMYIHQYQTTERNAG